MPIGKRGPTKRTGAHIISRAELARRAGIAASGVTAACRPGGFLARAVVGKGINALHPAVTTWLARKAAEREQAFAALEDGEELPTPGGDEDDGGEGGEATAGPLPSSAESEASLGPWRTQVDLATLTEPLTTLTERYGDAREMASWVKVRKLLEEARRAEMLRERVAGRLIARSTVVRMLDHLDAAFRLILTDSPRTVAIRIAPQDQARCSAIVRDALEQILDKARQQMTVALEADDPLAPLTEVAAE